MSWHDFTSDPALADAIIDRIIDGARKIAVCDASRATCRLPAIPFDGICAMSKRCRAPRRAHKLDPHSTFAERIRAAHPVWLPATVPLGEIASRGYPAGYRACVTSRAPCASSNLT